LSALISIVAIYFFIVIGYTAKKVFHDDINEKTLILISIYFLQPILTFWGLTRTPIDFNLVYTPFVYFVIVTFVLIFLVLFAPFFFSDRKDQSIFIATALIGNTGNLGIPLGIALFGEESIAYTSIINIANIFFIYTIGIYFFAREKYSLKQTAITLIKIPILWFAIFALSFNYLGFTIDENIDRALEMGAYAAIVLQLIIFGVYLSKIDIKTQNHKLTFSTSFVKLMALPIIGIVISIFMGLDPYIASVLAMSLATPLAVNNVNNAALFDCKPADVTNVIVVSTLLFLVLFYFDLEVIYYIFGK
jgi:predicted permease